VAIHPGAGAAAQDGPTGAAVDSAVNRPLDGWRQRLLHDLVALAVHAQHVVAVLVAEVGDVRAARLEDPQAEQAQHRHQGEVVAVGRITTGREQCLELQVGKSEGR